LGGIFTEIEIPPGLKPSSMAAPYGAAKAAPLQNHSSNIRSFHWGWWATVPLGLAAIACAVPWLITHSPELGLALQRGFALVCHQRAERSFVLLGGSVAVCARCLGIYLGAGLGLLLRVSRQVAWRWLNVAVALNSLDGFTEIAGIHGNWIGTRFVLGIALGMAGAMVVTATSVIENPTPATTA